MIEWLLDVEPSVRYPLYTRANVGEVFPDPVTPLSWTLNGWRAEEGWRDALVEFGAFDRSEFSADGFEVLGVFGGHIYLNVSISRIFGVRTPGLTPELVDFAFFGETPQAPPYDPRPTDESPAHTRRVEQTLGRILGATELLELLEDRREVEALRRSRPDLSGLSTEELVAWLRELFAGRRFQRLFARHISVLYGSLVGVGLMAAVAGELGDPTLAVRLLSGIGGVDSTVPASAMWELGRQVAASPDLTRAFDAGLEGLSDRLAASDAPDGHRFLGALERFLAEFGSRGPTEWEFRSPSWETRPHLALVAIDRMRRSPSEAAPQPRQEILIAQRQELIDEVAKALAGDLEAQGRFLAGVRSAGVFLAGRERSKTTIIELIHEGRVTVLELGRRMAEAGHLHHPKNLMMLTIDELDDFLDDPEAYGDVIRQREARFTELGRLTPPFVVNTEVPSLETWSGRHVGGALPPGSELVGVPGSPGRATGRARVIRDPAAAGQLEPGEVLVAPIVDSAWTPFFLTASAVVVDVGGQTSHAVIVAREFGIPCVVSVTAASARIPTGTTITVDGTRGVVSLQPL